MTILDLIQLAILSTTKILIVWIVASASLSMWKAWLPKK